MKGINISEKNWKSQRWYVSAESGVTESQENGCRVAIVVVGACVGPHRYAHLLICAGAYKRSVH